MYNRPLRFYKNCIQRHASIRLLALLMLIVPLNTLALGLGDMDVRSALNQPLDAEIELRSIGADELDSLTVALASSSAFEQAGIARPSILTQLRFQIEKTSDGKPYLHVFTQDPVREPFLNYLIEVNWASGHMLREYTVLLDPAPELAINAPTVQAPTISATVIAQPQPEPQSFVEPRPVQQVQADAAPVSTATQPAVPTEGTAQASSYGPTRTGDGLWSIAKNLLPADGSADVNQMMLALLKANPDAFIDNNINTLKSGYSLRVPTPDEITAVSQNEARSMVKQQSEHWRDRQHRVAAKTAMPSSASESAPAMSDAPVDVAAKSNAQLKLVPATDTPSTGTGSPNEEQGVSEGKPGTVAQPETVASTSPPQAANSPDAAQGSELEQLRKDLVLANEGLEAKRLENEELSSRLAELETQTASIQRLITLKNDELAALQKSMAELKGGDAAEPPASPVVVESAGQTPAAQDQLAAAATLPASSLTDQIPVLFDRAMVWLRNTIDLVSQDPMLQAGMGLGVLLLLGSLLLIRRHRRSHSQVIEAALPSASTASRKKAALAMDALLSAPNESTQEQFDNLNTIVVDELPPQTEDRFEQDLDNPDPPLFATDGPSQETHAHYIDEPIELPVFKMTGDAPPASDLAAQDVPEEPVEDVISWQRESAPEVDSALKWESGFTQAETRFDTDKIDQKPKADLEDLEFTPSSYSLEAEANEKFDPAEWQPTLKDETPAQPAPVPAEKSYEFDYKFDLDLEKEADLLAKANAKLLSDNDDRITDGLDFDGNLPVTGDEVATKLELARAYIEMGDPEGAQSILDEVIKEGDAGQRQQAQELMQRVG